MKKRKRATRRPERNTFGAGQSNRRQLNASWMISGLSSDMEIMQGLPDARARCRDLEWSNDYVRSFLTEVVSNVLGAEGMTLQMKIKEEADRVIYTPDEKLFIETYVRQKNEKLDRLRRMLVWKGVAESKAGEIVPKFKHLHRGATVQAGQPDVYANNLVEKAWREFSRKENFTVTRELTKREMEGLHFRSTARDGAGLIRKVKGFDNDFGFAVQLIDIDWLDLRYNEVLPNGNEVRMGKELNKWKECVAYHIIVRQPGDWRFGRGPYGYASRHRQRIAAEEILHPFIRERIDQTREIPWMISAIERLRMLGKYEEAELMASLAAACKVGYYYSDVNPEGGMPLSDLPNPKDGDYAQELEPGLMEQLEYGVKMGLLDPKHPNGNYESFRKGMLRSVSSGLPGLTYYQLSQDQESVNFSTARMSELPARDVYIALQKWEAENVSTPIFEPWLEAALMSGKLPLPVSKFAKFNQPTWNGRRWKGIDPIKEAEASKMNLLLGLTTRASIMSETTGRDFEEVVFELALEEDLLRGLNLDALLLENIAAKKGDGNSTSDGSNPEDPNAPKQPAEPAPAAEE